MSKHDLKAIKIQVQRLLNKLGNIFSDSPILYSSDELDLSDPLTLITRGYVDTLVGGVGGIPIAPWFEGEIVGENLYRSHMIDGIEYLFRSKEDGNTDEPSLTGGETVWERTEELGYPQQYLSSTNYPLGRIVWQENPGVPGQFIGFRSLQSSNLNHALSFSGDTEWWEKLGIYAAPFTYVPGSTYGLKAVVVDDTDSDRVYVSKIVDNNFALDYTLPGSSKWQIIGAPAGGSGGNPTSGTLLSSDSPLVITWDTDIVPDDAEGRTYFEKHGALEKVSIQIAMPDPANVGDNTYFPPNARFDEATKNILTIDNQGQKLYYVIGFGADGSSGGGGSMTGAEIRDALGVTTLSGSNTGDNAANTTSNAYADAKVQNSLTASTTVAPSATAVNTALGAKINSTEKGAAGGVAPLNGSSLIDSAYLPSYVDDVLEYANLAAFPATGETGKIYIALDTNKQYRWSGSVYIELVASPGTTDNVPEGSTNKYWTLARTIGSALTGYVAGTTHVAVTATDTILQAFQKLSGSISSMLTDIGLKAPLANPTFTGTVSGITKSMVGLGNVDNTADSAKPVSTAQQTALDLKAPLASPTLTGTPAAPTASLGTKTTQIATMQAVFDAASTLLINTQTASYTLVLSDAGKLVQMNVATANDLTIPLNSSVAFPVGTQIPLRSIGAGQTSVVATGGVTIQSSGSKLKLTSQYSGGTVIKVATDTWALMGDLSS